MPLDLNLAQGLLLAFDTAAAHCAAAVMSGDRILGSRVEPMQKGQAERLMPMLEDLLAEAGFTWRDLSAIGVGIGPGNFTGVRISVAAARGLALGLGVPAIGVSGLRALAYRMVGPVRVAINGPRDSFYLQDYVTELASGDPWISEAPHSELWPGVGAGVPVGDWPDPPTDRPDLWVARPEPLGLICAVAHIAQSLVGTSQPRPAPLYLRSADAAPSSDPPPVILR